MVELFLPPIENSSVTLFSCTFSPDVVYSASYHDSLRRTTVKMHVDGWWQISLEHVCRRVSAEHHRRTQKKSPTLGGGLETSSDCRRSCRLLNAVDIYSCRQQRRTRRTPMWLCGIRTDSFATTICECRNANAIVYTYVYITWLSAGAMAPAWPNVAKVRDQLTNAHLRLQSTLNEDRDRMTSRVKVHITWTPVEKRRQNMKTESRISTEVTYKDKIFHCGLG